MREKESRSTGGVGVLASRRRRRDAAKTRAPPRPSLSLSPHLDPGDTEMGALAHRLQPDTGDAVVHDGPLAAVDC